MDLVSGARSFITVITIIIFLPFICLFFVDEFTRYTRFRFAVWRKKHRKMWMAMRIGMNKNEEEKNTAKKKTTTTSERFNTKKQAKSVHQILTEHTAEKKEWWTQQRNYRLKASNLILHSSAHACLNERKSRWHF